MGLSVLTYIKSRRIYKTLLTCLLTVLWTGYTAFSPDKYSNPVLQILIGKAYFGNEIDLSSAKPLRVWGGLPETKDGSSDSAATKLKFKLYPAGGVLINGKYKAGTSVFVYSETPIVYQNRIYQGAVRLLNKDNTLYIINFIPTESYLAGVINAEINSSWHPEAVKTQTVIARTYALYRKLHSDMQNWDLTDSESDQVYKGLGIADVASFAAVRATQGEVIFSEGSIIQAFYHSNSGGYTEETHNIWSSELRFDKAFPTPFGKSDPNYNWRYMLPVKSIEGILQRAGYTVKGLSGIRIASRFSSGRVKDLQLILNGGANIYSMSGNAFRIVIGGRNVKSLLFDITSDGNNLLIYGKGFGHGVGVCQWCAKEMAEEGAGYRDIISYFYEDVAVSRFPH